MADENFTHIDTFGFVGRLREKGCDTLANKVASFAGSSYQYGFNNSQTMHYRPLPALPRYATHADDCECDACRDLFEAVMWGWLDEATARRLQKAYESGDIPASMK